MVWLASALLCAISACAGSIEDPPEPDKASGPRAGGAPSTPGSPSGSPLGNPLGSLPSVIPVPGSAPGSPPPPPFAPAPAGLRRLTALEYRNSIADLLGAGVAPPAALEPDLPRDGFTTVGAAHDPLSPQGVEQYDRAALALADQLFADATRRTAFVGCTPASLDDPCVRRFLQTFGRRAWRRPLADAEVTAKVTFAKSAAQQFEGNLWQGLWASVALMLESPHFLYRVELGEADPDRPGGRRFTSWEMATRLAYLTWASTPDDLLLDAAARGALLSPPGLRAEATRLLASPRARPGLLRFFREHLRLDGVDQIAKDQKLFPQMTPTLGRSMRLELERVLETLVFSPKRDFRDFFDGRATFVNAELARAYGLGAGGPASTELMPFTHPADSPRAGYLSTGAFLALNADVAKTSPTRRGKMVREHLLCQPVPPPPPDVEDALPDPPPSSAPQTTRQRLERHRADPACASCHDLMDPLGVALEGFDALGAFRTTERGLPIDTRATVDGKAVNGARELGQTLRESSRTLDCLVRKSYTFATGHMPTASEESVIRNVITEAPKVGYVFTEMVLGIVTSDGFRLAAEPR